MQKGNIRVQTENIFPIIKKFLYSEHDIFLRELVSNAVDATQKLKTLSSIGEAKGDLGNITVFTLPYEIENMIYGLKPGTFSAPYSVPPASPARPP